MDLLTSGAMAVLRIKRLLATQLVLDLPTVAATFVADFEAGIVLVDFVWGTVFPLVELALHVAIVTVIAVGALGLHVAHFGVRGVELGFELGETGEGTERGIGGYEVHSG